MKKERSSGMLVMAILLLATFVVQSIGLIRYISRLPGDSAGIILYVVVLMCLLLGSFFSFMQWRGKA